MNLINYHRYSVQKRGSIHDYALYTKRLQSVRRQQPLLKPK